MKRPNLIRKISSGTQFFLWKRGIHWHNWVTNECTPDFSCCAHIWKEAGMEHIKDALVDSVKDKEPIVKITKTENPN